MKLTFNFTDSNDREIEYIIREYTIDDLIENDGIDIRFFKSILRMTVVNAIVENKVELFQACYNHYTDYLDTLGRDMYAMEVEHDAE